MRKHYRHEGKCGVGPNGNLGSPRGDRVGDVALGAGGGVGKVRSLRVVEEVGWAWPGQCRRHRRSRRSGEPFGDEKATSCDTECRVMVEAPPATTFLVADAELLLSSS